jgi:hypothetical protein
MKADFIGEAYPHRTARIADPLRAGVTSAPTALQGAECQDGRINEDRLQREVGALKYFFDTVYYPSLDHVAGRAYRLFVHGNNDTVGAASAVEKLATGLELTKGAATLEVTGAVTSAMRERAYELGGTLAALLID